MNMPSFGGLLDCPECHGSGTLYDLVPWGMGYTSMPIDCYCIAQQQEEWITKKEAIEDELIFLENCDELTEELVARYDALYKLLQNLGRNNY